VAKIGTSNQDRTISVRLQCVVVKKKDPTLTKQTVRRPHLQKGTDRDSNYVLGKAIPEEILRVPGG